MICTLSSRSSKGLTVDFWWYRRTFSFSFRMPFWKESANTVARWSKEGTSDLGKRSRTSWPVKVWMCPAVAEKRNGRFIMAETFNLKRYRDRWFFQNNNNSPAWWWIVQCNMSWMSPLKFLFFIRSLCINLRCSRIWLSHDFYQIRCLLSIVVIFLLSNSANSFFDIIIGHGTQSCDVYKNL